MIGGESGFFGSVGGLGGQDMSQAGHFFHGEEASYRETGKECGQETSDFLHLPDPYPLGTAKDNG